MVWIGQVLGERALEVLNLNLTYPIAPSLYHRSITHPSLGPYLIALLGSSQTAKSERLGLGPQEDSHTLHSRQGDKERKLLLLEHLQLH